MPLGIYTRTKEHKKKLAEVLSSWRKEVGFTEEIRKLMSLRHKGKFKIIIEKEQLYKLYTLDNLHPSQIALIIGCSTHTIVTRLKYFNITTRNRSESKKGIMNGMYGKKQTEEQISNRVLKLLGHKVSMGTKNFIKERNGKNYEELYGDTKAKEIKEKLSNSHKESEKNKLHMEKLKEMRKDLIFPKKDSSIELIIQDFCRLLNLEYSTHCYINIKHAYQCDILIPIQEGITVPTIIECDGDAFHFNPNKYKKDSKIFKNGMTAEKRWELDDIRTKELIGKGYRVIRIWENEIRKMKITDFKEKLKEYLT